MLFLPIDEKRCTNCGASHLFPPLKGLPKDAACPFVLGNPCVCCGEPVRALSMGGDGICPYCDAGKCLRRPKTPQCRETQDEGLKLFNELFYGSRHKN